MTILKRFCNAAVVAAVLGSGALLAVPASAAKSSGPTVGSVSAKARTAIFTPYSCTGSTALLTEESCFNGMMYALQRFDGNASADTAILDVAVEPTLINYFASFYPSYKNYLAADPYSAFTVMETSVGAIMSLSNNGVFSSSQASALENSSSSLFKNDVDGSAEVYLHGALIAMVEDELPVPLVGTTNFEGTFILAFFIIDHQPNTWLKQFGDDALQEWSQADVAVNEPALQEAEVEIW
jgi:hypothetical protein